MVDFMGEMQRREEMRGDVPPPKTPAGAGTRHKPGYAVSPSGAIYPYCICDQQDGDNQECPIHHQKSGEVLHLESLLKAVEVFAPDFRLIGNMTSAMIQVTLAAAIRELADLQNAFRRKELISLLWDAHQDLGDWLRYAQAARTGEEKRPPSESGSRKSMAVRVRLSEAAIALQWAEAGLKPPAKPCTQCKDSAEHIEKCLGGAK